MPRLQHHHITLGRKPIQQFSENRFRYYYQLVLPSPVQLRRERGEVRTGDRRTGRPGSPSPAAVTSAGCTCRHCRLAGLSGARGHLSLSLHKRRSDRQAAQISTNRPLRPVLPRSRRRFRFPSGSRRPVTGCATLSLSLRCGGSLILQCWSGVSRAVSCLL